MNFSDDSSTKYEVVLDYLYEVQRITGNIVKMVPGSFMNSYIECLSEEFGWMYC